MRPTSCWWSWWTQSPNPRTALRGVRSSLQAGGPEVAHPVPHQLSATEWDQPGSRGRSAAATACGRGTRRDDGGRRGTATVALENRRPARVREFESRPLRFCFKRLLTSVRSGAAPPERGFPHFSSFRRSPAPPRGREARYLPRQESLYVALVRAASAGALCISRV